MRRPSARRAARGFTLIELMITVAVVAILASIALPAYKDSIVKGKRAQGRSALLELMTQQERYLTQNGSYLTFAAGAALNSTNATDATGATNVLVPFKTFSGDSGNAPAYKLGARACAAGTLRVCVQVFATPQFADPAVSELNITSTGAKDCTVNTGASKTLCWN